MSEQLRQDIRNVSENRVERVARPGKWRVFRTDDGKIHIEIFG